ncbi:MAG TPA: hypothetical protein DCS89_14940, partial [Gammaproteobacteria bacterium]|nr:hypothetical protein [Gammaproteobacteria bacterium]
FGDISDDFFSHVHVFYPDTLSRRGMLMRFAGIRKFSGSEPARNRSFGVQLMPGSAKWKQLHYSGGEWFKKRKHCLYKTLPE